MPRPDVQKCGGDKLPPVGFAKTGVAKRKIISNKTWLRCLDDQLRQERDQVCPDQSEKNNTLPLRPLPRGGRVFPAGEAHFVENTANRFGLSLYFAASDATEGIQIIGIARNARSSAVARRGNVRT